MALVSTVLGAITTLQGYMNTVAAATTVTPTPAVYLFQTATLGGAQYNYMMIGDYHTGTPVAPDSYTWRELGSTRRNEVYALQGTIACWSGGGSGDAGAAALARIDDAYSLLNALHQQILGDKGGSGNLSPSGSWGELVVHMEECGPMNAGWGVVLGFDLHVLNAQLFS